LVGVEDNVLAGIRARHTEAGLPGIQISADEGRLIAVLLRAIRARRVLEVGTLGGYSGVWIARALEDDGELVTLEANPEHAKVAQQAFEAAKLTDRVRILEGDAMALLPTLDAGFDAVFLDADKEPLPEYFEHGVRLLRVGGLLLCDNTFCDERVVDSADRAADVEGVRAYNRLASTDTRVLSAIAPVRDGLMISLKVRD
jgi:predicted O-methyltransferase YrrM